MAKKFQMTEVLTEDALETGRVGAGTGSSNQVDDKELNKLHKLVGDSRFGLCAAGDPIEAILRSVEKATLDDYTVGSFQRKGRYTAVADGLQATPGTGTIAVGDYVVCGTVVAKGTALAADKAKVCKATWQPGVTELDAVGNFDLFARVMLNPWRVVAILNAGTGAVGDTLVIERL